MSEKVSLLFMTVIAGAIGAGGCAAGANTGDGNPSGSSAAGSSSGAGAGSSSGLPSSSGSLDIGTTSGSSATGTNGGLGAISGSATSGISNATSGSATTGSGSASSGAATAPACNVTAATGAIVLATNYMSPSLCASAPGGYAYAYADKAGSTSCSSESAFCGQGTTTVQTSTNSSTAWGAGIGVNLDQVMGSMVPSACAAKGAGITYAVSGTLPPQGMRLIIDSAGMDYCAPLSAISGMVPWASFNTACWEPTTGAALAAAPATATHVEFQVNAAATAGTFDFCVTSLEFM